MSPVKYIPDIHREAILASLEARKKFVQARGIEAWRELEAKPKRLKREASARASAREKRLKREASAREQDAVEQQLKKAREQHWQLGFQAAREQQRKQELEAAREQQRKQEIKAASRQREQQRKQEIKAAREQQRKQEILKAAREQQRKQEIKAASRQREQESKQEIKAAREQQRKQEILKAAREQQRKQEIKAASRQREQQRKQEIKAASRQREQESKNMARNLRAIALFDQLTPEENIAYNGAAQNWDKEKVGVSTAKGASGQFTAFIKKCNEANEFKEIALVLRKMLYPTIPLNKLAKDDVQYMKIYSAVEFRLSQKAVLHRNFDKQTYTQRSSPEEALQKAYEVLMKCGSTHEKAMQIARKGIEDWDDFVHPVDMK